MKKIQSNDRYKKLVLASSLLSGLSSVVHAETYTLTDLGAPFLNPYYGQPSAPPVINNAGDVAESFGVGGYSQPFVWNPSTGMAQQVTSLPGNANPLAISDNGNIVGQYDLDYANGDAKAFEWTQGAGNLFLQPLAGNSVTGADAVNDVEAAGSSAFSSPDINTKPVIWQGTTPTNIGTLPGDSYGAIIAINSYGQAIGSGIDYFGGTVSAFLWTPNSANALAGSIINLGNFGGNASAIAINNVGDVVGIASLPSGPEQAFLWKPNFVNGSSGQLFDLGVLNGEGTYAVAINDFGLIGGYSIGSNAFGTAVLYQGHQFVDANTEVVDDSGWYLDRVTGINDKGQVVGWGTYNGVVHNFLLSPSSYVATPGPLAPLSFGLLLSAIANRKRRSV